MRPVPCTADKIRTITFDKGTEFHSYAELERDFDVTCYFATPYHSWERGSNENLNGLVSTFPAAYASRV